MCRQVRSTTLAPFVSVELLVQVALDFGLDRHLEHAEQKAQGGADVDLVGADVDMAIDATARKFQGAAFPCIVDVELFGDVLGNAINAVAGLLERLVVTFEDIDMRHRSEEHTSAIQSPMRNSYAVFCLTK